MGRALRTTLPTGTGGVVHLFVVYGYQGAEGADQLLLSDKLLQAVLATTTTTTTLRSHFGSSCRRGCQGGSLGR